MLVHQRVNPSVSWFWFSRNQWLRASHQSFGCCPSSLHINRPISILNMSHCLPAVTENGCWNPPFIFTSNWITICVAQITRYDHFPRLNHHFVSSNRHNTTMFVGLNMLKPLCHHFPQLNHQICPSVFSAFSTRSPRFGFSGEDYAAYDLPVAVVTVGVLLWASRAAEDATKPLSYAPKPAIDPTGHGDFMGISPRKLGFHGDFT